MLSVECMITWEYNGKTFKTRGLDSDQTIAAIKGTLRMLNILESLMSRNLVPGKEIFQEKPIDQNNE